ncbi:MAG: hypothetical protein RL708_2705 [Bacteroidota bacterium]
MFQTKCVMKLLFRFQKIICVVIFSALFFACQQNENTNSTTTKSSPEMVKANGKADLLLLTDRPPNLETPLKYFLQDFTPNDVFFVRWHLANLPEKIDADTFRLRIGGAVKTPLELSLNDLKTKFKPFTINALCACAGNARSFFKPAVAGAQWKNGGMGNAKWKGVKLKDILAMAGAKPDAADVSFNGLDAPPMPTVADFEKSLALNHAMDGEVMIAYEMNDEPIPLLNGFPLKLVVPGWYATYWVGMLSKITVHAEKYDGYWMKKAYLVPKNKENGNEKPDSLPKDMTPISKMDVRSIFVTPEPDSILQSGKTYHIVGVAMDGGDGIAKVEISFDNGKTWAATKLDVDFGKYSWRHWVIDWKAPAAGKYMLKVKATNNAGKTQPEHQWNRSGYMRNEIEQLELIVK